MVDFEDMRLFVRAVTDGSLSAAGRALGLSPAAASKRLNRLEQSLGVRLLQRSSRRLALTEEGTIYFERAQAIIADVDDANSAVGLRQLEVRGQLHVSASVDMGRQYVGPIAADFAAQHAALTLRLTNSDAMLDLFEHGVDVAVRGGTMTDSRLVSRLLTSNFRVLCASPAYLARRGRAAHPRDLLDHACLRGRFASGALTPWEFEKDGEVLHVEVNGPLVVRVGATTDLAVDAALAGVGIIHLFEQWLQPHLDSGALEPVLQDWVRPFTGPFLYYASRRHMPAPLRAFVDFIGRDASRASEGPGPETR